jgi:hypothetical protein
MNLSPPADTFPMRLLMKNDLWNRVKLDNFRDKQWKCLVPVFSGDRYTHNLRYDNYIFPFTKENENPKIGAFGFVYKVRVHSDHQKLENMSLVCVSKR